MSFLSGLMSDFGGSLSGGNHKSPGTRFTRMLDVGLDPLTSILGKNSWYTKLRNKPHDLADRVGDEANRSLSSVVKPIDEAISPYADPLYNTGVGQGLHGFVNNKPASVLGAVLGGGAAAGALGGGSAGGASGLGAGGTFSGALGESALAPTFGSAGSIGGSGAASFGAAAPSIGGTGTASFGASPSAGGFDTSKFVQNFLQKQGAQTSQQGAPPTYRSQLLGDYQPFMQAPADFNPNPQGGSIDPATLQMLISALKAK